MASVQRSRRIHPILPRAGISRKAERESILPSYEDLIRPVFTVFLAPYKHENAFRGTPENQERGWSSIRELNSHPQFGRLMCCRYTNAAGCSPFYTAAGAFLTVTQSRASQPGAPKCLRPSASACAYVGDAFLKKEEIHYAAARYAQTHSMGMGFGIGPKRWGDKAPKRTCSHRVPGECPELRAAAGVLAAVQDCDGQSTSILRSSSVDGRLLTISIARSAGNRSLFFPGFL